MLWELVLFSILVPTGYWGVLYVRRRPFGSATYGLMLLGTAALAGVALLGRKQGTEGSDVLGAIAVGAAVVQLGIAPIVRAAARWAIVSDRLRLAAVLVDVRDILQPGMGGREDKRFVAAVRHVKEGKVDDVVATLQTLRDRAGGARERASLDEQIVRVYLSAQRWQQAIDHAHRTLLTGELVGPLEMSGPVYVELITAKLRVGDLDGAAVLAERFERAARSVPEMILLVFRVHLVFLAHLGRVAAVDRLVDPKVASYVTPAARSYWAGVARQAAGDLAGARAKYDEARGRAGRDRRARTLVDESLAAIDAPAPVPSARAALLGDVFERAPVSLPPRSPARRATITAATIGVNLAVAAACVFLLDGLGDFGTTVRAGANVRGAVDSGEWWRLPASVFVHVGTVHLVVNLLALWSIGRLVEGLFGSTRTLVVYGAAGLAGALASHYLSSAGVSAGASGAIFGLLGAAVIELAIHRKRYRREWRRSLLGALVVVTVAQLAVGFGWAMIDQWAHVGGLVAGLAFGALLSPGWRWAEGAAARWLARGLGAIVLAIYVGGGAMALTHDYTDRIGDARTTRAIDGIAVDAPLAWQVEGDDLYDPDLNVILALGLDDEPGARARANQLGFTEITAAPAPIIAGAHEWLLSEEDSLGSTQRYRMVLVDGATLYAPEQILRDAAVPLGQILATLRPAP